MNLLPESTWTKPRPGCPRPDWWHASDEDSTEIEVTELIAGFVRALQPELVVETGTAWGQTAQAIGRALHDNGHGHLYTLEPDEGRAEFSKGRCRGLPVTVVCERSLDWWPPGAVDFAWFDSLLHLRVQEFNHFRGAFSPGAFVGFHDTGPQHEPLATQVGELEAAGLYKGLTLPTPRGVTVGVVL